MDSEFVRLEEVVKRCGVNRRSIYDWVKRGVLVPAERSRVLPGMVFKKEDVEKLEVWINKHISVHAAAKKIGVPYLFFTKWLDLNKIILQEGIIDNKTKYVLLVEWLEKNQKEIVEAYNQSAGKKRKKLGNYELQIEHEGLRLFGRFHWRGEMATIINVKPLMVRDRHGLIEVNARDIESLHPSLEVAYAGNRGTLVCRVPKSSLEDELVCEGLDNIVYYLGVKNVRVYEEESEYIVSCRFGILPLVPSILHVLDSFVADGGEYFVEGEDLIIGDVEKRLNIGIPYSCLKDLKKVASAQNISVQVLISRIVEESNRKRNIN